MPSEEISKGLDNFRNFKDKDIEDFLRFKALEFDQRGWCSTYLLVDKDEIIHRKLNVVGYFTLSNRVIKLPENISKTQRKRLFNGLVRDDQFLHVILIGQLGKFCTSNVSGCTSMEELLDSAFNIINDVNDKIPCRCVLLECREADNTDNKMEKSRRAKLHKMYVEYGFSALQKENNLVQYIITII